MNRLRQNRAGIVLAFLLAVAALAGGVGRYGYSQAMDQLAGQAESDLALASDRLSSQLQVYQELAVLMADHPAFRGLEQTIDRQEAHVLLQEVADKTAALDVVYAAPNGHVLASAQGLVGDNLSGTPYFERAMHGALGVQHGIVPGLERRAYYYAAPTFDSEGQVRGALVVLADVEDIEWAWRGSKPAVFFTDARGEVFVTNRSELLYWTREADSPGLKATDGQARDFSSQRIGPHEVWRMDWGAYIPERALHLARELPVIGLTGEVLVDVAPARRLALLQAAAVAAICLAFGAMLYLATERRRALAEANVVLETRVRERTMALQRAQADLVQAGKLSALGQMSAGISHELNQPLMAIRSFAENGGQFLERGKPEKAADNLARINELARRMGRIIKNLRAFARQESEPAARVDVVAVLDSVIELTGPRLRQDGVELIRDLPDHPVWARGGEVRLSQVFVNLISNAADAMADSARKVIEIQIREGARLAVTIRDSGPGIDVPDKMFEPFYSTKEVGASEGMGLGLSISYGIVQSFGGDIRGENGANGGAIFTVELEPWREEMAA